MRRPRGKAIAVCAATVIAVITGTAGVSGCDSVQTALDCAQTAATVARSVDNLKEIVVWGDGEEVREAFDDVDQDIDEIAERTDNVDVDRLVEEMRAAVSEADTAVEEGRKPDLAPLTSAGKELVKVCTPD